jgi:outer membrane protein insertion porin family
VDTDFEETGNDRINTTFKISYSGAKRTRYIGKIEIDGNFRTRDYVIREALSIEEGSQYNEFLLERSLQKVRNLGFFSEVVSEEREGTFENQDDIVLSVAEASTGSVTLSIAYSSMDMFNGSIGFEQGNLFGRAINLTADLRVSKFSSNFDFGFSKPNLFGTKARGGIGFVFQDEKNSKNPNFKIGFDEYIVGFNAFMRFNIVEYLSQKIAYRFDYRKIDRLLEHNVDIFPDEGRTTSEISTSLSYDRRDVYFDPRSGYVMDLDIAMAGLGGSKNYLRTAGHFAYYYPLYSDKLILKLETKLGYTTSLKRDSPLYPIDGFYMGGHNMRGFEYGGIGPRIVRNDGKFSNGLSGTYMYYLNSEVKFPIYLQKMFGLYGIFFINAGTTTGLERKNKNDDFEIYDSGKLRAATGFSLLFKFGLIGISFDFSKILRKESYDRGEPFRFDIGAVAKF